MPLWPMCAKFCIGKLLTKISRAIFNTQENTLKQAEVQRGELWEFIFHRSPECYRSLHFLSIFFSDCTVWEKSLNIQVGRKSVNKKLDDLQWLSMIWSNLLLLDRWIYPGAWCFLMLSTGVEGVCHYHIPVPAFDPFTAQGVAACWGIQFIIQQGMPHTSWKTWKTHCSCLNLSKWHVGGILLPE